MLEIDRTEESSQGNHNLMQLVNTREQWSNHAETRAADNCMHVAM